MKNTTLTSCVCVRVLWCSMYACVGVGVDVLTRACRCGSQKQVLECLCQALFHLSFESLLAQDLTISVKLASQRAPGASCL